MIKTRKLALAVLLFGIAAAGSLQAEEFAFWGGTGAGGITFSGTLTADPLGGGLFHATSGGGTITDGTNTNTFSLIPGGPGAQASPYGAFNYDNLNTDTPNYLNSNGLLFLTGAGDPGALYDASELNIFDWGGGQYGVYASAINGGYQLADDHSTFNLVGTPEPTTWLMMGSGLCLAGLSRFRKVQPKA